MHPLYIYIFLFLSLNLSAAVPPEPFRFSLLVESHGVDPQQTRGANGDYVLHLLYSGLYRYRQEGTLEPSGVKGCHRTPMSLICTLNPERRWSNGQPVVAQDYINSFRRLIDPKMASPHSSILFTLKNAREIWAGKLPSDKLGITAPSAQMLVFTFAEDDGEFEYKLIHPALSPLPPGGYPRPSESSSLITNGAYTIENWKAGSRILFKPNKFYLSKNTRPEVEAWFIDDDATALRMFESGKLNFLRRLVASEIPRFKGKPSFHQIPMARFDYIGFGPELLAQPERRAALVRGVDFATFRKLFDTLSPPGCPSLPARLMDKVVCQQPDFARAKALGAKYKTSLLNFEFSRMGGDDIARAAEWLQNQWSKNAGLKIELHPQEQGGYLSRLKLKPPAIFRKGVALDRPTCMAGLEIFTRDHPENYIHFNDPEYDRLTHASGDPTLTTVERQKVCGRAIQRLLNSEALIPLGEMFFTILADAKFRGWNLNELNQLDLSGLEAVL